MGEALQGKGRGNLKRDVHGGNVNGKVKLGKSKGVGFRVKALRTLAWLKKHTAKEPLCDHFKRSSSVTCPLTQGTKELSFSLRQLPKTIIAGGYDFNFSAVDDQSPVACVKGHFSIPLGPNGE